jgi:hypothetical protein
LVLNEAVVSGFGGFVEVFCKAFVGIRMEAVELVAFVLL